MLDFTSWSWMWSLLQHWQEPKDVPFCLWGNMCLKNNAAQSGVNFGVAVEACKGRQSHHQPPASSPEPPGLVGHSPLTIVLKPMLNAISDFCLSPRPPPPPSPGWVEQNPSLSWVQWHQWCIGDSTGVPGPDTGFAARFEILSNQKSNSTTRLYLQYDHIVV